ncbi:hypothetical protein [Desulforegula conservatrix]|nr:hypothetical protein [Desulforegula conservatrix]
MNFEKVAKNPIIVVPAGPVPVKIWSGNPEASENTKMPDQVRHDAEALF